VWDKQRERERYGDGDGDGGVGQNLGEESKGGFLRTGDLRRTYMTERIILGKKLAEKGRCSPLKLISMT